MTTPDQMTDEELRIEIADRQRAVAFVKTIREIGNGK
jgi:hypothetical protein